MASLLHQSTTRVQVKHQDARAKIDFDNSWTANFIDPDELEPSQEVIKKYVQILNFFAYSDVKAADKDDELWEEIEKRVTFSYARVEGLMARSHQLKAWCKRSIQHALSQRNLVSLDGSKRFKNIQVGDKISSCPYRIAGRRCFHFQYILDRQKETLQNSYAYCIGTVVGSRCYLFTLECPREEELVAYAERLFIPTLQTKLDLDVDVQYTECTHSVLQKQQKMFGEFEFYDRSAMVQFTLPMHPMRFRPDYSPMVPPGVGSLACATLELQVFQKLLEDFDEEESAGMPKHKPNSVTLYVEVEDVIRMHFPSVMSVDLYSELKTELLLKTFSDSKQSGQPLAYNIGRRKGRAVPCTFAQTQGKQGVTVNKEMTVSTLLGNHGVNVTYFTKLGQGLYDAHLYLFQHLLRSFRFFSERELAGRLSRHKATAVRLTEQDLTRAYGGSETKELFKHVAALRASTDANIDHCDVIVVPKGASGTNQAIELNEKARLAAAAAAEAAANPDSSLGGASIETNSMVVPMGTAAPFPIEGEANDLEIDDDAEEDGGDNRRRVQQQHEEQEENDYSYECDSVVTVSEIAHLVRVEAWDGEEGTEETPGVSESGGGPSDRGVSMEGGAPLSDDGKEANTANDDSSVSNVGGVSEVASDEQQQPHRPATAEGNNRQTPVDQTQSEKAASPPQSPRADRPSFLSDDEMRSALAPDRTEEDDDDKLEYKGVSLQRQYIVCCEEVGVKPNSKLKERLPSNPRYTNTVESLDLVGNYVGHKGFIAILDLLNHIPRVHTICFNSMSLDNSDIAQMRDRLNAHLTIRSIQIRNNPKVTLPAAQDLLGLLKENPRITTLQCEGCSLGEQLVWRIEHTAKENRDREDELAAGSMRSPKNRVKAQSPVKRAQ